MHIKTMINIIIDKGNVEDMHYLSDLAVDTIYNLKSTNVMWYHNVETHLHHKAYGHHLTEEQVKCAVAKLVNKDGTKGFKWDFDTVQGVYKNKGLKCDFNDFYYALNIAYSKHYQRAFGVDNYIELAHDIMNDNIIRYYYEHRDTM